MNSFAKRFSALFIAGLAVALSGCATTMQVSKDVKPSGFLGDDYSQMQTDVKGRAVMSYWASGVDWKKYTKVMIKPVELWKADDKDSKLGKLSPDDQKMLATFLYKCAVDDLETEYKITDQPGPDVLVIRAAITDARKSSGAVNIVSSVVPWGIAASYGKQAVTGTGLGVGDVAIEAEIRDGGTNQLLMAIVDRRAGTKALSSKFSGGSWGDVKLAFHWWTQKLAERLAQEQSGGLVASSN